MKDAAAEIAADDQSIAQKTEEKAAAETEKNEVESSLEGTEKAIADLEKSAGRRDAWGGALRTAGCLDAFGRVSCRYWYGLY